VQLLEERVVLGRQRVLDEVRAELLNLAAQADGIDRRYALVDIVQKLNAEINRAMQLPEVNAKLTGSGLIVVNESADYYTEFIKTEYAKYGKIVRDIGLQPQ